VPAEDWIRVPVPALVEPELFDAVQAQLAENRVRNRQRTGGERYLPKGCWSASSAAMGYALIDPATRANPGSIGRRSSHRHLDARQGLIDG
jgi:hypothetical protein